MLPPASNDPNLMNEHAYYERGLEEQPMNTQWAVVLGVALVGVLAYKVSASAIKSWQKERKGAILPEHN